MRVERSPDRALIEKLVGALNEVRTNGAWTHGDQCGEWIISQEVYGLVCEALSLAESRLKPQDTGKG